MGNQESCRGMTEPAPFDGTGNDSTPHRGCYLALIIIGMAVFANAVNSPLVFDDASAIIDNESIRDWTTAWSPPKDTPAAGRPIVNLSFALNYALGRHNPVGVL